MNIKKCPKYSFSTVIKCGKRNNVQRYFCKTCKKKFQNSRRKKKINEKIFKEYVWQRQTYSNLAKKYNKSTKWVQRRLNEVEIKSVVKINERKVVLVVDTTFFSRTDGVCVFREPNVKKNIWWKFVDYERIRIYEQGRRCLEKNGFNIQAIVLGDRRRVRDVFKDKPVQMCHFHQISARDDSI